jgi:hypothetical protein
MATENESVKKRIADACMPAIERLTHAEREVVKAASVWNRCCDEHGAESSMAFAAVAVLRTLVTEREKCVEAVADALTAEALSAWSERKGTS